MTGSALLRRLHPEPGDTTPAELAASLDLRASVPPDRPLVALNMVTTLDGRVTIGGRSGPIGGATDRELFHELRAQADAVIVGAGTLRTERYGRLVRSPERRARRVQAGLPADPLAVIVSASLDLPLDLPLLQAPEQRVVILTTEAAPALPPTPARVDYLRVPAADRALLAPRLARLRHEHGIVVAICEGGPRLNDALLGERLVDELFLSIAPKLAGGEGEPFVAGAALDPPATAALVSLHEAEATVFARYRIGQATER